jgi:hypothetical protein
MRSISCAEKCGSPKSGALTRYLNRNALASRASLSATTMMLATCVLLLRFTCASNAEDAPSIDGRAGTAASSVLALDPGPEGA